METVYRDYGALSAANAISAPEAPNNEFQVEHRRQVYQATHRGDGSRLPLMNRSFISFTYGGRHIEDFDLISTIVNNRLTKDGYASFNDITTTYENLDGQYYWNTHYVTNSLTFVLSTDGIDQRTLDDFLYWFHAGEIKELILAEHPNRAIMARVANPPQLSLLPFEHNTTINISGSIYPTKTTLYKGDITLNLVMDEPHWYAKTNILGKIADVSINGTTQKRYVDLWDDVTYDPPQEVDIFASKEALKILVEDGIPLGSMIDNNMLLGNGSYASVENDTDSLIWNPEDALIVWTYGEPSGQGARIYGRITQTEYATNSRYVLATEPVASEGGCIQLLTENDEEILYDKDPSFVADSREYHPGYFNGKIAGPIVDVNGDGIENFSSGMIGHFFYAGTAPSPTEIKFTCVPRISSNLSYIDAPANSYSNPEKPYNSITITSRTTQSLQFSTPNIYTSYNKAISIFKARMNTNYTWEDIFDEIRDTVRHPAVRAWAAYILTGLKNKYSNITTVNTVPYSDIKPLMEWFLKDNSGNICPASFTFNSKTGEAIGVFSYRHPTSTLSFSGSTPQIASTSTLYENMQEDVGDMLYSNYIVIKDRNYPNENGRVVSWTDETPAGVTYSHKVEHDMPIEITKLQILYRNMYL